MWPKSVLKEINYTQLGTQQNQLKTESFNKKKMSFK